MDGAEEVARIGAKREQLPQSHSIAPDIRLVGELLGKLQTLGGKPVAPEVTEVTGGVCGGGGGGRGGRSLPHLPVNGDIFALSCRIVILIFLELPCQAKI